MGGGGGINAQYVFSLHVKSNLLKRIDFPSNVPNMQA